MLFWVVSTSLDNYWGVVLLLLEGCYVGALWLLGCSAWLLWCSGFLLWHCKRVMGSSMLFDGCWVVAGLLLYGCVVGGCYAADWRTHCGRSLLSLRMHSINVMSCTFMVTVLECSNPAHIRTVCVNQWLIPVELLALIPDQIPAGRDSNRQRHTAEAHMQLKVCVCVCVCVCACERERESVWVCLCVCVRVFHSSECFFISVYVFINWLQRLYLLRLALGRQCKCIYLTHTHTRTRTHTHTHTHTLTQTHTHTQCFFVC